DDGEEEEDPVFESVKSSAKTSMKPGAKQSERDLRKTNSERKNGSQTDEQTRKNTLIIACDEKKSDSRKKENRSEYENNTALEDTNDGSTESVCAEDSFSRKKTESSAEMPVKGKTLAWEPEEQADEGFSENEEKFSDEESNEIMILPPDPMVEAPATEDEDFEELPLPPEYEFPPIDMLKPPEEVNHDENVSKELRENADKIIDTLESFHVHVGISHVSRGPTVTRYELEPAAGTRVRSITNLLDDIALSLATSGVRSDGIITGKSAIGIEVPNKTVNTVYIRELIEDDRFADAKSRLTTCLGMDVSGAPVYLDIAKMPHLLIAGATGMGKSVCINSLLVSLLYKARPDEVKLILIDPKKVELNIYNGIPHLLVPVVFDPKKAAGSLHWAVTEMERRFELIEAKNTRNIAQYNAVIADDPTQEVLPQIVIVIDELADLMMSAPDDVEASICRLAQKARAAGMHLIIGTQRPSVDVITGLIKANIPSRIAFTVASQIDSRTIIDAQGAEKLIGRGDMLYAPVGAPKPIRVQGSFVSETEIEEIIGFIRAQSAGSAYSDDVMAQINRAAELCGQKKGKGGAPVSEGDADDSDPMLDSAVALAVETGKISTSLIQRRLSLGYGRAAKIIDMMERRGIVGPPEGQKPRTVLITREQYLEMQMNKSDDGSAASEEAPF
ncbi:MAG: DNA translocase FtsK, partial [Clostridia bacterium]|nr:DNA translocase FtsK [Clostridia bacterium]